MNKPGNHRLCRPSAAILLSAVLGACSPNPPVVTVERDANPREHPQPSPAAPAPEPVKPAVSAQDALDEYFTLGPAEIRARKAPDFIRQKIHSAPEASLAIAREFLLQDLWVGQEIEKDGVVEVHVSRESFEAAREVARTLSAAMPGETAALLAETPGEIREIAIDEWAATTPSLAIEDMVAFLTPLAPDQSKGAAWKTVEAHFLAAPDRIGELRALSDFLPMDFDAVVSQISRSQSLSGGQ